MQTIHLDLDIQKEEMPRIVAKQGTVGFRFQIVLTENAQPYLVPSDAQISVWYQGGGTQGCYSTIGNRSAFAVEENRITVELAPEVLKAGNGGMLAVYLHRPDGTQLGIWNILYDIENTKVANTPEAQDYFVAFGETVRQAVDAAQRAESAAQALGCPIPVSNGGTGGTTAEAARENLGAAPAGYGLGGNSKYTKVDNLDDLKSNGWYCAELNNILYIGSFGIQFCSVEVANYASDILVKQVVAPVDSQYTLERFCIRGEWQPWEWVNPPMTVGAEYRTTERYNGKPVYTKLIDCGASVNEKVITFTDESGNPTFYTVIRHAGRVGTMSLPVIWGDTKITTAYCHMYCDGWRIRIFCTEQAEFTGQQSYCQIWYTKD